MDITSIYNYAAKFVALAQENYSMNKRYVFDQFFNAFRDGRYTALYDSMASEYNAGAKDIYGITVYFNFIESPKSNNNQTKVSEEVVTALQNSKLGPYIHAIEVQLISPKKYICIIQFKPSVTELMND